MLAAVCAALSLCGTQIAQAQDFPTRPVRIVVAFPPGGPTDFVGRLVADKMTALLGQRVYIDNKPGANGTLGGGDIAKSDPDGYSLFLTTAGAVVVSPHIMASMPYDTLKDFVPVALVTKVTEVMVVKPEPRHQVGQGSRGDGQGEARHNHVRLDRHRLAAASGAGNARRLRRRAIPPRALSWRRAGIDRPARRPGAGRRARHAGGDLADPRRHAGADRRRGRQARSDPARRSDIRRTRLSEHRRVELVRTCWRRRRHRLRWSRS